MNMILIIIVFTILLSIIFGFLFLYFKKKDWSLKNLKKILSIIIVIFVCFSSTYYFTTTTQTTTTQTALIVETDNPTDVESTSVTLHGTLLNNGTNDTSCYFLWGENSSNYDHNESVGIIANGTSFKETLTGLKPATIYFYNTKANNQIGWDDGEEKSFFTTPALSKPTKVVLANTKTYVQDVVKTNETPFFIGQILDFSNPDFGVPDNAIAVLCLVEQGTGGRWKSMDFMTNLDNSSITSTGQWMKSQRNRDNTIFYFVFLRGNGDKKAYCFNAGDADTAKIYLYGWVIETNETSEYGNQWVYLDSEQQVLTNSNAISWSDVNCSSYIPGSISSIWVTVTSAKDQIIYFRQKGSSKEGISVKISSDSPQQLLIPTNDWGSFQYYTSYGYNVNIWLHTYLKKCSIYSGDRFLANNKTTWNNISCDGKWHSLNLSATPDVGYSIANHAGKAKFVFISAGKSPNAIGTVKFRMNGTSNVQDYRYLNGCGGIAFLVGVDSSFTVDYSFNKSSTNAFVNGFIYPSE
jgi:hypothetical protein